MQAQEKRSHKANLSRRVLWILATVVAVAFALVALRRPRNLPPLPELADRPPALREALAAAESRAREWRNPFAGVAELGRLYHANGYIGEARRCWAILSEREPDEGRWAYYLADLDRTAGAQDAMRDHLREALRRAPDYAPGWLRLAEFLFKTGRLSPAADAYARRLALVPGDPYARLGLARIALQEHRLAEARSSLEALVREVPDFASAQNVYAELLAGAGDEPGAVRHRWLGTTAMRFHEADDPWLMDLRAACYDAGQLLLWAAQERQSNRTGQAEALFERALSIDPTNPLAYAEYGQMLVESGRAEAARNVLVRGIEQAPFHDKVRLWLSEAWRTLGRAEEALAVDQRALELAPNSAELLNSLGQSLSALGRTEDAEQAFRKAGRLSPGIVGPPVNLALICRQTGRRDEARRLLRAAVEANPDSSIAVFALAGLLLEDRAFDDAEQLIRPYARRYPGLTKARTLMAQLFVDRAGAALESNNASAAERLCRDGLQEVADSPELLGMLGHVHLLQGDTDGAIKSMEACRRLIPGDPRAVLPLVSLYRELGRPADARRILLEARGWLQSHGPADQIAPLDALLRSIPEG